MKPKVLLNSQHVNLPNGLELGQFTDKTLVKLLKALSLLERCSHDNVMTRRAVVIPMGVAE